MTHNRTAVLRRLVPLFFTLASATLSAALIFPARNAGGQPKPMAEADVLRLLKTKVPSTALLAQIRQNKISFPVTKSAIEELKGAGASREILEALRSAQPVGLVWSAPAREPLSENAFVEVTPLVVDGSAEYLASTTDDRHVLLLTNAGGAWKAYPVAQDLNVGNSAGSRFVALAVHEGVAFVLMSTSSSTNMQLILAYNPGKNPAGPWVRVPVYSTASSHLQNPSASISGDSLMIAYDDVSPNPRKDTNDVYLGIIPLSSLDGTGKPPSVKLVDLCKADDSQEGPDNENPQLLTAQGQLDIVWQHAGKSVLFGRLQSGADPGSLQTQVLHTVNDPTDKSLELAANGNVAVMSRFAVDPDGNDSLGCCDVYASTNTGGTWSTTLLGRTDLALEAPGVAVGECGPSVTYVKKISGNGRQLEVVTFADGQWRTQDLKTGDVGQPRLAATRPGLDLAYISAVGEITLRSATCYPPPAPLD